MSETWEVLIARQGYEEAELSHRHAAERLAWTEECDPALASLRRRTYASAERAARDVLDARHADHAETLRRVTGEKRKP